MTGGAHVAFGLALAVVVPDWRIALPLAAMSHPVLDCAAQYHPRWTFTHPDTAGKRWLVAGNAIIFIFVVLGVCLGWLSWYQVLVGLFAWLSADYAWGVRAAWPRWRIWNPHKYWWIKGREHPTELHLLWIELMVMIVCMILAVQL